MKETIEYYYSLKIDDIYLEGDTYHFLYDNCDYYFVYCCRPNKELNDIVECSKEIKNKNIVCHDIILNIQNNIITKVEGLDYLLLRVSNKNKEYSIVDIVEQNKKTKLSKVKSDLYRNDWSNLWSSKIDYIESQMNEINVDRIIRKSIDYYIGLA